MGGKRKVFFKCGVINKKGIFFYNLKYTGEGLFSATFYYCEELQSLFSGQKVFDI